MTYLSLYLVTQFEYVRLLAEIQIIKAGDMVVITEMLMMMMIMLMLILMMVMMIMMMMMMHEQIMARSV